MANQRLSLRRANAVKLYLATHGIAGEKIKTTGRGKTSPVADNKTTQGRARNRRVDVRLLTNVQGEQPTSAQNTTGQQPVAGQQQQSATTPR